MDKEKESENMGKYEPFIKTDLSSTYQKKIRNKSLIISKFAGYKKITFQDFQKDIILKRKTPL